MQIARSLRSLINRASRPAMNSPRALLESLETRQMMAKTEIVTFQGDQWALTLTGPGTFANVQPSVTAFGIPLIALTGTTVASDFSVARVAPPLQRSLVTLNIETITGGTLNSITLEADSVDLESQSTNLGGSPSETGILLTGYARTITVGDIFGADIRLDSTSSLNRSTITAGRIQGSSPLLARGAGPGTDVSNITSGGVIEFFGADNYAFGTIQAARIGAIQVATNVISATARGILQPEFDIVTTSTTATFGVKTIDVGQDLFAGTWTIAAPVQRINLTSVGDSTFARGNSGAFSLNVTGRVGQLNSQFQLLGTATARAFGSINAGAGILMNINTTAPASNTANSIDSIRAARLDDSSITVTNGIGLINVGSVIQQSITAGWIDTFNVTGTPNGDNEIVVASTISLTNAVRTTVLRKFNVQGAMDSSSLTTTGSVGDVVLRGMTDSRFLVGISTLPSFPTAVNQIGTRTVNSFTLSAPIGSGVNFANSTVSAATFSALRINNPNVTTANGGTLFGFVANTITSLIYRAGPGSDDTASNINAGTRVSVGDFRLIVL